MNRKLIALATAIVMSVAAMTSSVFAVDEMEISTESDLGTSASISTGTIGDISTEEVDLEQQRIIFQRQREFEANLETALAIDAQRTVNPSNSEAPRGITYPEALDLAELVIKMNETARNSTLGTAVTYQLVTLYQFDNEIRQAIVDNSGRSVTGWEDLAGGWKYKVGNSYVTGLYPIGSEYYYFDEDEYMVHGWQYISGESSEGFANGHYYFGTPGYDETGALYDYGWLQDPEADDAWYYMDPEDNGRMYHGLFFYENDEEFYYLGSPGYPNTGAMYTYGWLKDTEQSGDPWYYFRTDGTAYANEWLTKDGHKYLFRSNGKMYEDEDGTFDSKTYHFDTSGAMVTGFYPDTVPKRYFGTDGAMITGWFELGDDIYCAKSSGTAKGYLYTGPVYMSDYVMSVFDASTGVWEYDTMRPGATYMGIDYSTDLPDEKTRYNIRINPSCFVISNGFRYPNISVEAAPQINQDRQAAIGQLISYYNHSPISDRVELSRADLFANADVNVVYANLALFDGVSDTAEGVTISYDENGNWTPIIPHGYSGSDTFKTGHYVNTIIFLDPTKTTQLSNNNFTTLLRHEMGHALGLRHPVELSAGEEIPEWIENATDFKSLMWPYYNHSYASTIIEEHDINEMQKTYPGGD